MKQKRLLFILTLIFSTYASATVYIKNNLPYPITLKVNSANTGSDSHDCPDFLSGSSNMNTNAYLEITPASDCEFLLLINNADSKKAEFKAHFSTNDYGYILSNSKLYSTPRNFKDALASEPVNGEESEVLTLGYSYKDYLLKDQLLQFKGNTCPEGLTLVDSKNSVSRCMYKE